MTTRSSSSIPYSERQLRISLEAAQLSRKGSLHKFVRASWPILEPATPFADNWHIGAICDHLEALTFLEIQRLLINVPPGSMKSLLVSVMWPAWAWTFSPHFRWLFASHSQPLSTRDSVRCRRLIESTWYRERWGNRYALEHDQNQKTRFDNDRTGFRIATSVGGGATGERGHFRAIDDPHKVTDAASDQVRESQVEFFRKTWPTRTISADTDRSVVIMQRLHESDVSGYILSKKLGYEHLCIPMEFEPSRRFFTKVKTPAYPYGWEDPRTEEGELLHPERMNREQLGTLKTELGPYDTAGQLQQSPSPAEGGLMKRGYWHFWCPPGTASTLGPIPIKTGDGQVMVEPEELPDYFDQQAQGWDMSFKKLNTSDPVAGHVWATHGANRYLLGRKSDKMGIVDTIKAVLELSEQFPEAYAKYVESAANGPAVVEMLGDKLEGLILATPQELGGSKTARVIAVLPAIAAGNVFLPHPAIAPWVWDFIEQCAQFPNAAHDDDVDAMTLTLIKLRETAAGVSATDLMTALRAQSTRRR